MRKQLLVGLSAVLMLLCGCSNALTGSSSPEKNDSSEQPVPETKEKATWLFTTTTNAPEPVTETEKNTTAASSAAVTTTTTAATTTTSAPPEEKPSDFVPIKAVKRPELTEPVRIDSSDKGKRTELDTMEYYYCQLDEFHRKIYDAMLNSLYKAETADYKTFITVPDSLIWDFSDDFYFVYAAVMDDHPEYFRYDEFGAQLSWNYVSTEPKDGCYELYIYSAGDLEGIDKEIEELETAADAFLADIDLSGSEYEVALRVHDKLIDLVTYEDPGLTKNGISYAQSCYGALVSNGVTKNAAVCEGYADAYSYLLKRLGIMCLPLEGGVASGEEYEETVEAASKIEACHTWDLARLDGIWYEIDPTWDDYSLEEQTDFVQSLLADKQDLIYSKKHFYWCRTTREMEDLDNFADYVYYTDGDGGEYSLVWAHNIHVRASDPGSYYYYDSGEYNYRKLIGMLPEA